MWKKSVCQPRKIKHAGSVDYFMGLLMVFVVSIVMLVCVKLSHFMIAGACVEDALAASNLASALIDVKTYGRDGTLKIFDPQGAYEVYKEALFINLQLDEDGRPFQRQLLEGPVTIEEYRIYNVIGEEIEMYMLDQNQVMQHCGVGRIGEVVTLDGVEVETTTIYSRVSFGVPGFGAHYIQAKKENSVDVKKYEEE